MSLGTASKHFMNASSVTDSTTSLGSPFTFLTTLSEKKFFLIPDLNLPQIGVTWGGGLLSERLLPLFVTHTALPW